MKKFPKNFESKFQDETELIRMMLKDDPKERPDTKFLLKSNLIPSRMEDDLLKEAMNIITKPNTAIFSDLMEKIFSIQPDISYDYQLVLPFSIFLFFFFFISFAF